MNSPYRTQADVGEECLPPMRKRLSLPDWQKDPTSDEIKLFDLLVVGYLSLGKNPKSEPDEDCHEKRMKWAVEGADYALALRRQLIGKK